jgi:hypothetical protein
MIMTKIKDKIREREIGGGECLHYWLIESADGPTSMGVCKHCGAEREFFNSLQDFSPVVKKPARVLELAGTGDTELEEDEEEPDNN